MKVVETRGRKRGSRGRNWRRKKKSRRRNEVGRREIIDKYRRS